MKQVSLYDQLSPYHYGKLKEGMSRFPTISNELKKTLEKSYFIQNLTVKTVMDMKSIGMLDDMRHEQLFGAFGL